MEWMPFELAPEVSVEGESMYDYLPKAQVDQSLNQLNALGQDLGIQFKNKEGRFNTRRAHLAGYYAKDQGLYDAYSQKVFEAYFIHGNNIAQKEVLDDIAKEIGLDAQEMNRLIDSNSYQDRLMADFDIARRNSVNVVPTFVVNNELRFEGAMTYDEFKSQFTK